MREYYPYIYLAFFWSLRYVIPSVLVLLIIFFYAANLPVYSISAVVILILDIAILWLLKIPKKIISKEEGISFISNKKSDFLLIVSENQIKSSSKKKRFDEQDWSYAWVNTLLQEAGSFSVIDASRITEGDLEQRRVLILSKSASGVLKDVGILKGFAQRGGIVVLECPETRLEDLIGAKLKSDSFAPKKIDHIDDDYRTFLAIKKMPLDTMMIKAASDEGGIIAEFDGYPAIIKKPYGSGAIITLFFDFARQLVSMQQGRPLDNYNVLDKTSLKDLHESQDLVLDKSLEENDYPFADMLEKLLFQVISDCMPIPRLWYLKNGYSGAFIMSHDEDYFGDGIRFMIKEENQKGVKSAFFITPSRNMSKSTCSDLLKNSEFGLHWDRMKYSFMSIPSKVYFDQNDLTDQIKMLEFHYGLTIKVNRNHFLKWDSHYTNTFRALSKAGIKVDSTYGPNSGRGYLFGTNYGFYPLDTNGLIIPVLEVPFQTQELRRKVDISYIKRLVKENDENYHGIFIPLFHPENCLDQKLRKAWIESINIARSEKQWITNFSEFKEFLDQRMSSKIVSGFVNGRLKIDAYTENQTLMIPLKFSGKKLSSVHINKKNVAKTNVVSIIGFKYCLIKIPNGKSKIEIDYLAPGDFKGK